MLRRSCCFALLLCCLPTLGFADELRWLSFSVEAPPDWALRDKEFVGTVTSKLVLLRSPNDTVVSVGLIDARRILSGFGGQTLETMVTAYVQAYWVSALRAYGTVESWTCALAVPDGVKLHGIRFSLDGDPKRQGYACGARELGSGLLVVVMGWAGPETKLDPAETEAEVLRAMSGAGFSAAGSAEPRAMPPAP